MDQLEEIFNKVSKQAKDGKKYIFLKDERDIQFLYATGFVNARKFTYKEWLQAFANSKQPNNTYVLTKDQWLAKKTYHYRGKINEPFDPMSLEEKEYTEAEILDILKKGVVPSTIFDENYVTTYLNNLKAQGRVVGGKVRLDKQAKEFMLQILNAYPSPMRVLEVSVHELRKVKKGMSKAAKDQIQKSAFSGGQSAQQIAAMRLANLAKTQQPEETKPVTTKEAVSLKDLQKKRGPGRI